VVVAAHIAAAGVPLLFTRLRPGARGRTALLRELYPIVFVLFVWTEMGLVRDVFHTAANDAVIAAADQTLFGCNLQAVWMPAMPQRWFSEVMFFIYVAYYPAVFLTPVVLFLRHRTRALREVTLGLTVAYLACYVLYTVFPVDGRRTRWRGSRAGSPRDSSIASRTVPCIPSIHWGSDLRKRWPVAMIIWNARSSLYSRY